MAGRIEGVHPGGMSIAFDIVPAKADVGAMTWTGGAYRARPGCPEDLRNV
jgi:hypothetical protein